VALRAGAPGSATRRPFVGVGDPYFSREQAAAADRHARGVITALGDAANAVTLRASPPGPGVPDGDPLARRTLAPDAGQLARLPRLPETADEIRAMAQAVGADTARDVFLGARAARSTLLGVDLSRYRVVAFATHGLVPGELEGLTQPALALTSPDVTGVAGDGVLTMEDILGLKLDADWVVLSACNTAAGDGAGAEAVSGLGRAFFYAGARALLVTNWPVETTSARALTTQLFRRQQLEPALTRARALQQTLVAMIDSGGLADARGRLLFAYAHPIFWAPFTLFGNGG
jgi:CHAT domain-containing protein